MKFCQILVWFVAGTAISYLFGIYLDIHQEVVHIEEETDMNVGNTCRLVAAMRGRSSSCQSCYFAGRDVLAQHLAGKAFMKKVNTEFGNILEDEKEDTIGHIAMRALSIDDRIMGATKDIIKQVVVLGSGMDSRPYRLNLTTVKWFEVDVAEILELKEQLLSEAPEGITILQVETLSRVPLNLKYRLKDLVPALEACGFDKTAPTLFLMEGLIMYLSVNEVRALFQALPVVRGSRVVVSQVSFGYRKAFTNPVFNWFMSFLSEVTAHKIAHLWKSDHLVLWLGDAYMPWKVVQQINLATDQLKKRGLTLPKSRSKNIPSMTKTVEDVLDLEPSL